MNHTRSSRSLALVMVIFTFMQVQITQANNMKVTNTVLSAGASMYTFVQCDIGWDHSWRASWEEPVGNTNVNWDAAWIFVKYRYQGGAWQHASLDTTNSNHLAPAGSTITVGLSTNTGGTNFGAGVFLYRSAEGSGSWSNTVKLRWNFGQDGLTRADRVDVCVHAIEMVYVPQGSFKVGSGGTEAGSFTDGSWVSGATIPFTITNETALTITNAAGYLWGTGNLASNTNGGFGALPASFPKGYNAFYCMKYKISQGQYADFLNQLTPVQAGTRYPTNNGINRFTITSNANVYAAGVPDRACNWASWADGAAYADWAGLRPMTELEFEKACRGPATPVAGEYAWGNTTITDTTNFFGTDGSGSEIADPTIANSNYGNNDILGPVRCGIYATAVSGRADAGASYWGIMEMSGNLWERPVTIGNATGRAFTGLLGDGSLDSNGNANVNLWPGSNAVGSGYRGGAFNAGSTNLRTSDRYFAVNGYSGRDGTVGIRVVRPAP